MKICLIPSPVTGFSRVSTDGKTQVQRLLPYLPVGILTLSTLLENAGHQVSILDPIWENDGSLPENCIPGDPDYVARLIQAKNPDLVGFSTICSSYPLTIKWAESFHRINPETPIMLGGPQATATAEQTLKAFPWISMVLRDEAENSIVPLVGCLQSNVDLATVPGLTWRRGAQIIRNPDAPVVVDFDTLPNPAYHLYPVERLFKRYNSVIGPFHHPFPLEAGRGCPFDCSFCSTSGFFRKRYRAKSISRLINEMISLNNEYGLAHFDLAHDLFTCDSGYVLDFCHRLQNNNLHKKLSWECYSRIDTVNKDILAEMAKAGCTRVFYGIETGSQRIQKIIGKNLRIQEVKSVVKDTLSLGMKVTTSFICGFPQERQDDLSATLTLAAEMVKMGVDQVGLLPLIPLVRSRLYREFGHTIRHKYQGQEPGDPDVFASLGSYETPYLDSDVLAAIPRAFERYPRLLAVLAANKVDLMTVFNQWPEWCRAQTIPESCLSGNKFGLEFLQFLREILKRNGSSANLDEVIRYHLILERTSLIEEDSPFASEIFNCDVPAVMQHMIEEKPPTDNELQPTTYLFWKNGGKVFSCQPNQALSELFKILKDS